jgi:hypothetical protein
MQTAQIIILYFGKKYEAASDKQHCALHTSTDAAFHTPYAHMDSLYQHTVRSLAFHTSVMKKTVLT